MDFSTVKFRDTDVYDNELTNALDQNMYAATVINHIIKYNYGEIRSSDHIQTSFARFPNSEEMETHKAGYGNGWPQDTYAWRCFYEGAEGSAGDECQSILDYPFDDFDYVRAFRLEDNLNVIYEAYSFRRAMISHIEIGEDGLFNSISKPLLTTDEYVDLSYKLKAVNPNEDLNNHADKIYRFILTENDPTAEGFDLNNEVKIVDFIPIEYYHTGGNIIIFNSLEEADDFYSKLSSSEGYDYYGHNGVKWDGSYDILPNARFTNGYRKYVPNSPEEPKVNQPEKPKVSEPDKPNPPATKRIKKVVNTSDATSTLVFECVMLLSIIALGLTLKRNYTKNI